MKTLLLRAAAALASIAVVAACNPSQRDRVDSAAGSIDSAAGAIADDIRAELTVLDVDIGKRAGEDNEVDDEVETFASTDTIYASVNTTGLVRQGAVTSQWVFPDSSIVEIQAQPVTRDRDANLLFFLAQPDGLKPGKYTFRVLVDGREVRSQDLTVR